MMTVSSQTEGLCRATFLTLKEHHYFTQQPAGQIYIPIWAAERRGIRLSLLYAK